MTATVALYVSGHGYGHSVRSSQVAAVLLRRSARVVVRTDAPTWLFPPGVQYLRETIDVGVAQRGGLELDIDATRDRWRAFAASFPAHEQQETQLLREHGVDFVLGDIPPLAFAAAARAGIASAALGNFTWDWIYAAWQDFDDIVECIRNCYSQADVLLRLPLHSTDPGAFAAFRAIEDVPLIARCATRSRSEVRRSLGVAEDARLVLLSFGAWTTAIDLPALGLLTEYTFVVTPPLAQHAHTPPPNILCLMEQPADYVSLLAACDVVVTKPGYGIVADCLANRVAVLYTDRGPFREYRVLADALERLGRARFVSQQDLLTANIAEHLRALLAQPDTWADLPLNGAEAVADRVLQ